MTQPTSRVRKVALILDSQVAPRRRTLAGIARYIHEHDPWAIYLKPYGIESSLLDWLRQWNGDGIIAAVWDEGAKIIKNMKIPVVDLVGFLHKSNVPLVHADDHAIGKLGAEHLLERGFRNFGFIEHPAFWSTDRRLGFESAIKPHGLEAAIYKLPHPSRGKPGPGFWEEQQKGLVEWIRSLPKPVGVMASTDLTGQQFLEACQRAGVIVPEQVAVIGADNDELVCDLCSPPLSSVIINDAQRGYEAASLLDRLIKGQKPPTAPVYVAPAGVACRASTDILAIDDELLAMALRFIRDHACEGISVDDVVASAPLSRSVMERRFRRAVGRSINDEIVRVRLNRAVELLCATELELKTIAFKSGFGSPSYMGAVFRDKLGRTPGSYRSYTSRPGGEVVQGALPVSPG